MVTDIFTIALPWVATDDPSAPVHQPRLVEAVRPFIAGPENRLVQVAIEALRTETRDISPLVLYGPSGSGKSHLLSGMMGMLLKQRPTLNVVSTGGSDFAREISAAIRQEVTSPLRARFHSADLFVLEDLQELLHFASAQESLLHLLDVLERQGTMVLLSCRENPLCLEGFSTHLRSRLASGLCVPLVLPGQSTREVLIRGVATQHGRQITDLACQKLAAAFPRGLIELRGVMARLVVDSPAGQTIDTDAVRGLLQETNSGDRPPLKTIATRVAKYFGLKLVDLKSGSRRHSIVEARSIAMVLARELTDESLKKIGAFFGGRDHTTVMHAIQSIQAKQQKDPALREAMVQLQRIIQRQSH